MDLDFLTPTERYFLNYKYGIGAINYNLQNSRYIGTPLTYTDAGKAMAMISRTVDRRQVQPTIRRAIDKITILVMHYSGASTAKIAAITKQELFFITHFIARYRSKK